MDGLSVDPSPVINWDFLQSQSLTSFSRTSNATLFDSTGQLTYAANNLLLNTATLSTQTVTTGLQAGVSVILSFSGTGSVAISGGYTGSLAGTGVSDRVSLKFTTTTNSLTFTVTGSVTSAQLEVVTYQTTPSTYTATTGSQYYGPRYPYAYNGSTWDAQGLLVEAAGTNLVSYSGDLSAFSSGSYGWGKLGLNTVTLSASAPDGSSNRAFLSEDTSNGRHDIVSENTPSLTAAQYTASVYLKAGTRTWAKVRLGPSGNFGGAFFNLSNGTIGTVDAGYTASVESVGNGWYRCRVTTTATASVWYLGVRLATGNTVDSYTGDGSSGLYAWGAQLEAGDLSSYIPNLATGTTTRNADTSLAFSAISLPTGLSFSRASNAMQYDAAGRLTYAPNNLLTYSNDFSNAAWVVTGSTSTMSASTATDPLGGTSSWTQNNTGTGPYVYQSVGTFDDKIFTASVYLKKNTARYGYIILVINTNNRYAVLFDLQTGTFSTDRNTASQLTERAYSITDAGNGWYRCSVTGRNPSGGAGYIVIENADTSSITVGSFNLDISNATNGQSIYVFGAQVEAVTYETLPRPYNATTTSAYYGPRYDYDPTTRLPKGLLVEEGRTNIATDTETFTGWTVGATAVNTGVTSPSGSTSKKLDELATTAEHTLYLDKSSQTTATFSCYMKMAERRYASLRLYNALNETLTVVFDLLSGVVTQTTNQGTTYSSVTSNIFPVGNGWFRCYLTSTRSSGTTYYCLNINTTGTPTIPANGGETYLGVANNGIYIYGAQIEAGSFPTSYIPNPGIASGIRSADIATLTGTALTTLQGSAGSAITETSNWCSNNAVIISDASYNLFLSNNSGISGNTVVGGPQSKVVTLGSGSLVANQRQAIGWSASGYSLTASGASVATGTALTTPGTVYLGSNGSATFFNGYARKFAAWNVKLADAKLQQKSVVGATL